MGRNFSKSKNARKTRITQKIRIGNQNRIVRIIKGIQMNIHANFRKDRTTGKHLQGGDFAWDENFSKSKNTTKSQKTRKIKIGNQNGMFRIIKGLQMNIHANFREDRTTGKHLKIGGTEMLTEKKEEKGSSGPIWPFSKNHNFFSNSNFATKQKPTCSLQ